MFVLLGVALVLLPLFDRTPERSLRRRPAVAAIGILFFFGFAIAWVAGFRLRTVPVSTSGELAPFTTPAATVPRSPLPTLDSTGLTAPATDSLNSGGQQ